MYNYNVTNIVMTIILDTFHPENKHIKFNKIENKYIRFNTILHFTFSKYHCNVMYNIKISNNHDS